MANLDLSDETTVGGDAIPAILNIMQSIFPRDLEMLHDEHDRECWRRRYSAWDTYQNTTVRGRVSIAA